MKKRKSGLLRRMIVVLLSIVLIEEMVWNTVPADVFAQENVELQESVDEDVEKEDQRYVFAFSALPEEVRVQTVLLGTDLDELMLPDTLEAVVVWSKSSESMDGIEKNPTEETEQGSVDETEQELQEDVEEETEQNPEEETEQESEEETEQEPEEETEQEPADGTEQNPADEAGTNLLDGGENELPEDREKKETLPENAQMMQESYRVALAEYYAENVIPVEMLQKDDAEWISWEETVVIEGIVWEPEPEYDANQEETYIFTAVLPEEYVMSEGCSVPQITVMVVNEEQTADPKISGWRFAEEDIFPNGELLYDGKAYRLVLTGGDGEVQIPIEDIMELLPDHVMAELIYPEGKADGIEESATVENVTEDSTEESTAVEEKLLSIVGWECAEYVQDEEGYLPYSGEFVFVAQFGEDGIEYEMAEGTEPVSVWLVFDVPMAAASVMAAPGVISVDQEWGDQTLASGTYTINPGVTVTVTGQLSISDDVIIEGGGKLIRGDAAGCFNVSGGDLTLKNIEIDGTSLSSSNSMIKISSAGKVTLGEGCWIHHCYKNASQGSVLNLNEGSAVFKEAVIENCQATSYGGAIYMASGSSLKIYGGIYRSNRTEGTSSYGGGFVYNRGSKLEIYSGSFLDNTSGGRGGCIYNTGISNTETYLYGGCFKGNQSTYTGDRGKGSGAVYYSSENTNPTIINLSGEVQFCGDGIEGSGTDGVLLDLGSEAARKAQISSKLTYPLTLYLKAEEGRVIAEGVDGYKLQQKDMKKIAFVDVGSSGTVWYAMLDAINNQIILTTTDPGYGLYMTYAINGGQGNVSDNREYSNGDMVTVLSGDGLQREGYRFVGWNTKPDGTGTDYQAGNTFQITEDVTLYAKWISGHKVTYDYRTNDGSSATQSTAEVDSGANIDLTPTAIKTGWEFAGWNTDKDAHVGLTSLAMGEKDVTLYAIFQKELTFEFYSGSVTEVERLTKTLYNNQKSVLITLPKLKKLTESGKEGYTAYRWNNQKSTIGTTWAENTSLQAEESMNFYGLYQKIITISYDANGGNGNVTSQKIETHGIMSSGQWKEEAPGTVALKEGSGLSRAGCTFNGWIKGSSTGAVVAAGTIVRPTEDTIYYASWEPEAYTVTLHTNGGSGGTNLTAYTYGEGAQLPMNWTRKGYTFGGWYDNAGCTGTAVISISGTVIGNKEYWAKWTDNIAPVIGGLEYSYQPKNLWQQLIGRESLIIIVPVTEEGSGADEITYTVTPDGGTTQDQKAEIKDGQAKITVSADFKGTIAITCTDQAGNTSSGVTVGAGLNATGIIIEDNAPQIEFKADNKEVSADVYSPAPDITVTVTDDKEHAISAGIASVTYQIGDGEEITIQQDFLANLKTEISFIIPADEISPGTTVITVRAADNAGNENTVTQSISVHMHSYGTEWKADVINHWHECVCGEKSGSAIHNFGGWITDKEATESEEGQKHRICQICNYEEKGTDPALGIIDKEVLTDGKAPDTQISISTKELSDMLLEDDERQQVENGTDIRIILDVKDAESSVSTTDKELVETALNSPTAAGFVIGQYLDISLYKLIGESRTDISETPEKITVMITIPDGLRNVSSKRIRTFAVLRVHNDQVEFLKDLDNNADTITIATDRFSTYVIVYKDMVNGDTGGGGNSEGGNGENDSGYDDSNGSSNDNSSGTGNDNGSSSINNISHNNNSNSNMPNDGSSIPDSSKDNEPKTGETVPLELYATLAMIAGFSYLCLYFTDHRKGMTEETKKELVSQLIGWAKKGGRIRKLPALAAIFLLLVYYHSIGKKTAVEWKEVYGE